MENSKLDSKQEISGDLPNCRVRKVGTTKLVMCLEQKGSCENQMEYGREIFCIHPLKNEIVKKQIH